MSSNGRLLRKLRRIMGTTVALPVLVACSSQISYGETWIDGSYVFNLDNRGELTICTRDGVIAYFPKNFPKKLIKENVKSVLIGEGIIDRHMVTRETFKGWTSLEKIYFCGSDKEIIIDKVKPELNKNADKVQVTFDQVTGTLSFSGTGMIDDSWQECYNRHDVRCVHIGSGITGIDKNAFVLCANLEKIDLSDTHVNSIGRRAFTCCSKLKEVIFPDSLTDIGNNAFFHCVSLKEVNLLNTHVNSIGEHAFDWCTKLEKVTFSDSLTSIGGLAFFECNSLKEVDLSNTHVNSIGGYAFDLCTNLEKVTFSDSLTSIGGYAFYNCTNLEKVKFIIPSFELNNTDLAMFKVLNSKRENFTRIKPCIAEIMKCIKPNPLKELSIGNSAFQGCAKLKQIEVPGYAKIDPTAFGSNTNVVGKEVFVPDWYPRI